MNEPQLLHFFLLPTWLHLCHNSKHGIRQVTAFPHVTRLELELSLLPLGHRWTSMWLNSTVGNAMSTCRSLASTTSIIPSKMRCWSTIKVSSTLPRKSLPCHFPSFGQYPWPSLHKQTFMLLPVNSYLRGPLCMWFLQPPTELFLSKCTIPWSLKHTQ